MIASNRLAMAAFLVLVGAAGTVACGTTEESAADPETTTDAVSRPKDCREITLGELQNGTELSPKVYGQQPTFRGPLGAPIGDPALADVARIRIDAATKPGKHSLVPTTGTNCYQRGEFCVIAFEDTTESGDIKHSYAAVAGTIDVDEQITTDQSSGKLRKVELREITIASANTPWDAAELVPNGECLWIEKATFDTRRPDGCNPLAPGACGAGKTCIPQNAAGSDGTCVASYGAKAHGEECALDDSGASDCALGNRCTTVKQGVPRTCTKLCDILGETSACPAGTGCGPFGMCIDLGAVDPAAIGESCKADRGYCGRDGARGQCFTLLGPDRVEWPHGSKCWPMQRSRAACEEGQDLGYLGFGSDRSLGVCTTQLQ